MKTKSLDTPTIDELKKIVYDLRIGGKPKSGFITDNDLEKIDNATQAILQWHKSKARSYVLEAVERSFIPLSHLYDKYSDECFHLGVTDSPNTFFDSEPVKKLIDQTLKAIEESK